MGKWKPRLARKKKAPAASKGRLISCLILLAGVLLVFFLLFAAGLHR